MRTDNGPCVSRKFTESLKMRDVNHSTSAPLNPEGNVLAERQVKEAIRFISANGNLRGDGLQQMMLQLN